MFVAVTRISGLPPMAISHMVEAFRRGAQDLKAFPGFVGFELWTAEGRLEAVSRWDSQEAMAAYRASPAFGAHHGSGSGDSGNPGTTTAEVVQFDAEVVV